MRWVLNGLVATWAVLNAVSVVGYHGWPGGYGYLSMSLFFLVVLALRWATSRDIGPFAKHRAKPS